LASGDRAAAIRQFERCAAVLQAELGSAPLPETRALYEAARDGARPIPLARRGASIAARDAHTPARGAAGASTAPAHPAAPSTATASPEATTTSGCLPVPPEPLVGRATELALTLDLLRRADVRLVTLCGPGGSGKTRLALEVGAAAQPGFAGDVAFVPLAPVRDPALVLDAIARACGVREAGGESLMDVLRRRLRDRRLLLVLDNFEHLLPAAPLVAELLAGTPQLCVLVTSRAPLHLRGEHTVEVPPLPLPALEPLPPLDALAAEPAVALLIARTRAHDSHFRLLEENARAVAEVCVRLEGLPLAIELAAARLRLLSPGALLERLEHRLALLTGGARDLPDRHRTLRATVAWSHRLLDAEAQLVFERLAVFDGGWDIPAAEAVCGATGEAASSVVDSLQALLEAHLIHRTTGPDGEPRFGMLETIREYARERLEASGDAAGAARAHALHYLALAEEARNRLQGSEQQRWFNRLAAEHENVRAALRWASAAGRADVVARIGGSILHFWYVRGHLAEGRSWLEAVLAARKGVPLPALARAAYGAGLLALRQGDAERAGAWYGEAYALYDRLGDAMGMAQAATGLGQTALHACRFADAQRHFHRSVELHRAHGHQDSATLTRSWLAAPSMYQGDYRTAITALEEAIAVHQRRGDTWNEGATLARLGQAHLAEGDLAQARRDFTAALRLMRPFEPREGLAWVLEGLGAAAAGAKDAAGAAHLFGAAEALRDAVGVPQPPHFRRFYAPYLAAARADLPHEA
ncbi:MAG TPA: AAA family ATPase, partial [Chloroflexota bacterium]|nr:AAA family ATPase [Chloroflexota bacterium]